MSNNSDNTIENSKAIDFDYWRKLASGDPDAFEAARKKIVEAHIKTLGDESAQERMRRLQWRIDIERQLAKTPMEAAIRIYDMMWESVGKNFEAIQQLAEDTSPDGDKKIGKPRHKAKVLNFNREECASVDG